MKTLSKIENELKRVESENSAKREKIFDEGFTRLSKELEKTDIEKTIAKLEFSRELTGTEFDEYPARWIRIDISEYIDAENQFQRELFERYLSINHCVSVDFKNECLLISDGPCLIITEDGDVYDQDSQKQVIDVDETRDEDGEISEVRRNKLIEHYMNAVGYFPSVVSCDRYGNMFYVNTQSENKNEK